MITIDVSQCHCEIVKEAIREAIPYAKKAGIDTRKVIEFMNTPTLDSTYTVHITIDDAIWACIHEILRHHPHPEIGDFFIHHLNDLAADSQLGYNQ